MSARAEQIPFSAYRAASGVNKGRLDKMAVSPLHFITDADRDATDALSDGRLIHSCVLELPLYEATTCTWKGGTTAKGEPTMSRNSTAYKEFKANMSELGREEISASKDWLCRRIRKAVLDHPVASSLVSHAQAELSVFWTHPLGIECKSRLDLLCRGGFVADLKTAADITPEGFGRAAHRYGYGMQAAFYQDAAFALTGEYLPYRIIACEKAEPFDVAVYEVGEAILAMGRAKYCDLLRKVIACRESGEWPGVAPTVQNLEFPLWAYADEDEHLDWEGIGVKTA